MNHDEFRFYSSENDGYRGGFGDYTDPIPTSGKVINDSPGGKHKKGPARAVALVLCCALAGGSAGVGGAALYNHLVVSSKENSAATVIQEAQRPEVEMVVNTNKGKIMTAEQLYQANLPSCVGITVSTTTTNYFGQTSTSAASGSGFVLTKDGYIVTNYHVIEDAAKDPSVTIEVSFANDDKYTAKYVGGEEDNDVAVLKIDATNLTPVTLGNSDDLVVGEDVYAIGNPLGELTFSLSDGLVSALDRLITTSGQDASGRVTTTTLNVFQTNCAINPGNSGGPLFDAYGNVIGITTAKYTQSQSGVSAEGLGFAVPINDVKDILQDLIEHGYVTGKPYMGVQVISVSSDAQRYGIPAGAAVESVADGSCAEKAGLQQGDIIIAIDDIAIDSPSALTAALSSNYKAGDTATLTVIRQQREQKLTIIFDEKNETTQTANQSQQNELQQEEQQVVPQYPQQDTDPYFNYFFQWPFGSLFP